MEGKIICFSAANKESRINYEKTVTSLINLKEINKKFPSINIPPNIHFASIWGARWEKLWKDININDIALFYANRRFISYGMIVSMIQSKEIAEYLWGTHEYKNLVLMSPHIKIDSSREKFWKAFNYAPHLYIQGLRIPYVRRQREIINEYGSLPAFLKDALDLQDINLPKY